MEEKDGNELRPYKNDLDYLDDQFELILLKVKTHSIRGTMEMTGVRDETWLASFSFINLAVAAIIGRSLLGQVFA